MSPEPLLAVADPMKSIVGDINTFDIVSSEADIFVLCLV